MARYRLVVRYTGKASYIAYGNTVIELLANAHKMTMDCDFLSIEIT